MAAALSFSTVVLPFACLTPPSPSPSLSFPPLANHHSLQTREPSSSIVGLRKRKFLRDIQLSNILLDDNYEVRLGSLSEACAQEGETLSRSSEQGKSDRKELEHFQALAKAQYPKTLGYAPPTYQDSNLEKYS